MKPVVASLSALLLVAPASPALAQDSGEGADAAPVLGPAPPPAEVAPAPKADPAWTAFIEGLGEDVAVENPTSPAPATVGRSSAPAGPARGVALVALVLLLGLLGNPRTRGLVLARLRGASLPAEDADVDIRVLARKEMGAGRSLVALEVEDRRILLSMGAEGVEVIDRWGPEPELPEPPVRLDQPAHAVDPRVVFAAPVAPAEAPEADAPGPGMKDLLAAWVATDPLGTREGSEIDPTLGGDDEDEAEREWWMDGADEDERARLLAAAEEAAIQVPQPPPAPARTSSVLARLRAARAAQPEAPAASPVRSTPKSQPTTGRAALARIPLTRIEVPVEPEQPRRAAAGGRRLARLVLLFCGAVLLPMLVGAPDLLAAELPDAALRVDLGETQGASAAVKLLVSLTFLAVLPAIVLSMTSFTRLIVVFSMLRQALAVQQAPPNQILIGLALFLTWFIMGPTFDEVHAHAIEPYMDGEMSEVEAAEAAMGPMRDFMLRNTEPNDLALFLRVSRSAKPATRADVPTRVIVPAFLISELKTAFQIGFLIYLPFLVIDLVVSTVLLAMGMMVLPPVVISLPFKLLLFVFVDGWNLLAGSLVAGFA